MQTQTISAKELRSNLPKIISSLKKGNDFTLIYRSKPVAEIKPITSSYKIFQNLLNAPSSLHFKSKKSSVELVREVRGPLK